MDIADQIVIDNFDLWSSAVKAKKSVGRSSSKRNELYGVTKLRELILGLAVRGMLVNQDANEEPASNYLERVASAKKELLKTGKIKRQRPLADIDTDSAEFPLPRGWSWERLGNLVEMYNGRAFKSTEWRTEGLPIVRIQNLNDDKADFNYYQGELSEKNSISDGSFLISWSGTPGTSFGAFIWERGPAALNQHINKCEFYSDQVNLEFMRLAVNGQMNNFISKAQGGVGLKHVTKGTLNNAVLGIPPFAEQTRIVSKVNELMALCDQLEQEHGSNLETHETLVCSLLSALTSGSADADQFAEAWQSIQDNFDILFTTENSINQLKQSILQLAIMGKLLAQDPGDEPVDLLLERIDLHKERLTAGKRIKKTKASNEEEPLEAPFPIPLSWRWQRFQAVANIASNLVNPNGFPDYPHLAPDNIEKGNGRLLACKTVKEDDVRSPNHNFYPGQIIYSKIRPNLSKVVIVDFEGLCSADMYPIDSFIDARFLHKYMLSAPFIEQVVRSDTRVAMPKTNQTELNQVLVPVPPLAEQHRIATKVDELMALCDLLKRNINSAQAAQVKLADSLAKQAIHRPN